MVDGMGLTNDEIIHIFNLTYMQLEGTGFTVLPGIYGISALYSMLKSLLPSNVNVNFTIDDIRLTSKLKDTQTTIITRSSFFVQLFKL